jgi:hypothetical protein
MFLIQMVENFNLDNLQGNVVLKVFFDIEEYRSRKHLIVEIDSYVVY